MTKEIGSLFGIKVYPLMASHHLLLYIVSEVIAFRSHLICATGRIPIHFVYVVSV